MLAARDDDIRTAQRLILGGATVNDRVTVILILRA